jgi:hypothetical protein
MSTDEAMSISADNPTFEENNSRRNSFHHNDQHLGVSPGKVSNPRDPESTKSLSQAIVKLDEVHESNQSERIDFSQKFYCYICMDNIELSSDVPVTTLSCGHKYCEECFIGYIRSRVIDGQVNLQCFYPTIPIDRGIDNNMITAANSCNYCISAAEISHALRDDEETLVKYQRFARIKGDAKTRECCYCNHMQVGDPSSPIIKCSHCERSYCFFHANAHPVDETCASYEARVKESLENSVNYISSIAKPCPKCGISIGKIDGCNHMKCSVCNQAFCWICGKPIDDTVFPAHFQWWNPYGCANLQMNDAIQPSRYSIWSARILTVFEILILGPVTLVSTLASLILCSCCLPHYFFVEDQSEGNCSTKFQRLVSNCLSGWGMFWIAVLFFLPAVFVVLSMLIGVGAAAFAMLYPIYATYRICAGEYPWPDPVTAFFKTCFDRAYIGCVHIRQLCCCVAVPAPSPASSRRSSSLVISASSRHSSSRRSSISRQTTPHLAPSIDSSKEMDSSKVVSIPTNNNHEAVLEDTSDSIVKVADVV